MIEAAWNHLQHLDELASQKTIIHRLNPVVKLLTTIGFIISVVSFHKYELIPLLPLILYPVVLISLSSLPFFYLLKRLFIIMPFVLFIGLFNPLIDHTPVLRIGSIVIGGGWVSFISILIRFGLTVFATIILIATSGLNEIGFALIKLKIPRVFVVQILFLYRYLNVLLDETASLIRAHSLRSLTGNGLQFKVWGSLVGQLLLRTLDRAGRIYQAMLCRGFCGEVRLISPHKIQLKDYLYLLGWIGFFVIVRLYNIPEVFGSLFIK